MKLYKGIRIIPGYKAMVYVDNNILDPNVSRIIRDYSEDFEWNYFGSGPSQLALAILYDVTGNKDIALLYCQDFKNEYIGQFEQNGFILLESQVKNWLDAQLRNSEEE